MTTFTLPAPPAGPVWLADHPERGGPLRFEAFGPQSNRGAQWHNAEHDITLPWEELLALGDVDDGYPGGYPLHGTATPWRVDGRRIFGADGTELVELFTPDTDVDEDKALAALVVELVNAHAAQEAAGPAPAFVVEITTQPCGAEAELARRETLDHVVVDLVSLWRMVTPERREAVDVECGDLVPRLDRVVAEATRLAANR